jgi:peptidoglycan glycosyltransferase
MVRVATASFAALAVLALWLTAQQTIAGSSFRDDPRNARSIPDDPGRGPILTADGIVVAEDRDGTRVYPEGEIYLHPVGVVAGGLAVGVEDTRSTRLWNRDEGSITSWLIELLGGDAGAPGIQLTVVDRLQRVAHDGLEGRTGAVVAIDTATGAVLAYAVSPTADPNELVAGTVDPTAFLDDTPALDRVAFRLLPPGSTFKVLVAAAALEQGFGPESTFEDAAEYLAPGAGQPITNVTGGRCSGTDEITLRQAVATSCNTVFAELAVELGPTAIADIAARAGFNAILDFELGAAISSLPTAAQLADPAIRAQTGLGERDTRVTPLQMAVITAALGNRGELMRPFIVERVVSGDGTTLDRTGPQSIGRLVEPEIAAGVVDMMRDVVISGTGRAGAVAGIDVAGKTGTAEGGGGPHAWFIALAPAENPTIAVVVVVEGEGTGGTTAAPIAARLLEVWFEGS